MKTLENAKDRIVQVTRPLKKKKYIRIIAILIIVSAMGYFGYQSTKGSENIVRYTLSPVTKGTLITTVSGTGQVDVTHQVEVKSKASGEILSLNAENGQEVKSGFILAKIDSTDAQKSVRDAALALQNAQLSLKKTLKPTDDYTITQSRISLEQAKTDLKKMTDPPTAYDLITAQNSVAQAERDLQKSKDDYSTAEFNATQQKEKNFDDGYSAVSNAFLDMPQIVKDIKDVQWNDNAAEEIKDRITYYKMILGDDSSLITSLTDDLPVASSTFDSTFEIFKSTQRNSDYDQLYELLDKTEVAARAISESLESSRNVLDAVTNREYEQYNLAPTIDRLKTTITTDIPIINKHITTLQNAKDTLDTMTNDTPLNLLNAKNAITSAEEKLKERKESLKKLEDGATPEDILNAQANVEQKQQALDKLLAGADELDVKAQQLNVKGKQNSLLDANNTLSDYSIKVPFDCVIAQLNVSLGDTVSGGTSIATVITKQLLAQISLNEVDVAKVKIGQKATLTFDAIDSLSISGDIVEIDTLGTVSQGVVTYNVKIAFDTQDERIKPGMSVSAAIITEVRQDVTLVPNSAIKTQGTTSYVEMFETSAQTTNITNLTSNNTNSTDRTVTSLNPPIQQIIETGIANDTETEVISGLNEGDMIVTKTTNSTAKGTPSATSSTIGASGGLRLPGMGGGGRPN